MQYMQMRITFLSPSISYIKHYIYYIFFCQRAWSDKDYLYNTVMLTVYIHLLFEKNSMNILHRTKREAFLRCSDPYVSECRSAVNPRDKTKPIKAELTKEPQLSLSHATWYAASHSKIFSFPQSIQRALKSTFLSCKGSAGLEHLSPYDASISKQ